MQAARAYKLGLPLESAESWGLNRAIFIAAAKRGFKGKPKGEGREGGPHPSAKGRESYMLGDDMAYKAEKGGVLLFTIGGEVQTKDAFDRQVAARFGSTFGQAWKEAQAHIDEFPKETLLSAERFFADVYRPVRDELAEKWTEAAGAAAQPKRGVKRR